MAQVHDYVDGLVHASARPDALTAARHRAFIAPRLLGGLIALAIFPLYLALRGVPGPFEVIAFGWLIAPIAIAFYLSRTGNYQAACMLSSLALTGLVTAVAFGSGGIASFAAIWLVVIPLEAAMSASRRTVAAASLFALGACGLLIVLGATGHLPPAFFTREEQVSFAALGIVSAALYATGLALGAESLARKSLRMLSVEEARYRLLARNMTDVITRHARNGAVLFVSPAAEQLFGVGINQLSGHGVFDRVHVTDRPAYLKALADAAAQGEAQSVEFRVRRDVKGAASPQLVWVEMRCRVLDRTIDRALGDDLPGHGGEVVAVMRDVTERKAQEQALEAARAEAERANAAKSRFLATMSHELRTPLNAIIGFSEMLTQEQAMQLDIARRRDYSQLINDSGHHLLSVVNLVLDMSKIETGNFEITPEPFMPAPVIVSCCDLLALKARETGIELAVKVRDLPEVVGDKRALKQIVINLLSNAIKFTDRGGTVTVIAQAEGSEWSLTIQDTGVGIAEDDLPRLGAPFFQARGSYDRPYDGTGLGLSIVKGLVALHGGTLEIGSKLRQGTRVTVRLPIDCERVQRKTHEATVQALPLAEVSTDSSDIDMRKRA